MSNLTLKIELSEEDRARLDGILEAIKTGAIKANADVPEDIEAPELLVDPQTEPAPEEPVPETAQNGSDDQVVTTGQLQSKVVQLISAGKKEEVKAIVTSYAKCVSDIPGDKRAEVLTRLEALGV